MNKDAKKIRRSSNRLIAGVCAGLAEYLNLQPWIVRVIFLILALVPHLTFWMICIYVMLIALIPAVESNPFTALFSLFGEQKTSAKEDHSKNKRRIIKDARE
ncbi:MAG: PspC domain-containing protein, partial [Liquorilactobacillus satsumensis]